MAKNRQAVRMTEIFLILMGLLSQMWRQKVKKSDASFKVRG
jgi:hypothetical protein